MVSPKQRRQLDLRDCGCIYRGCDQPASRCEAHHLVHRADGVKTRLDNLAPLGRRHHKRVHEGGEALALPP